MSGVANGPIRELLGIPPRGKRWHANCPSARRPCEAVFSCRFHMFTPSAYKTNGADRLLVDTPMGAMTVSLDAVGKEWRAFRLRLDAQIAEAPATCTLDFIEEYGALSAVDVAQQLGVTTRQVEKMTRVALIKLRAVARELEGREAQR